MNGDDMGLVEQLSNNTANGGCTESIIDVRGGWQPRGEFNSGKLQAVCARHKINFRLVAKNSDSPVYSKGICTLVLGELFRKTKPGNRVFFADDQAVLMAIYYTTRTRYVDDQRRAWRRHACSAIAKRSFNLTTGDWQVGTTL
ncbi:MAG: hypothetical protein R3175_03470 [Marinobacter sp.]|uniref:hypothetical protein n=1 Tax=Marinobacter sp. TaxID=50741 RepID=UPI00299DC07C|nr:hypothetical protein [Marinobacter sp.]MDX1755098.1 hypothetical protein [Marinobacter sp.]